MSSIKQLIVWIKPFGASLVAMLVLVVFLGVVHRLLLSRASRSGEASSFQRQLIMIILAALGIVVVIMVLPVNDKLQTHLLALMGILVSGVVALSSTTLVANGMAGFMLRSVRSFRCGDFIRVGNHFGRVTERGLFHTEIQTEDRDLTTLPNLFLISNPVNVVRSSGTIVSATLSLGYDVSHSMVEPLLLEAAEQSGLEEPFVRVMELGNFAVTYRVSGLLTDVKQLLTARSALNARVLDVLHSHRIEIMSPSFMTQRRLAPDARILPADGAPSTADVPAEPPSQPETVIFDKAEEAERVEKLKHEREELNAALEQLEKQLHEVEKGVRPAVETEIARKRSRLAELTSLLSPEAPGMGERVAAPNASPVTDVRTRP